MALTNAYAACACGENLATAARGPSSTPTVTRTTRSSLLSPVSVKDTAGCAPASSASTARQRRVDPRRGRSCSCTTTVSDSALTTVATWSPDPLITLCCIVIAPCDVLGATLAHQRPSNRHNSRCAVRNVRASLRQESTNDRGRCPGQSCQPAGFSVTCP